MIRSQADPYPKYDLERRPIARVMAEQGYLRSVDIYTRFGIPTATNADTLARAHRLEQTEEALHHGVIIAVTLAPHAHLNMKLGQYSLIRKCS